MTRRGSASHHNDGRDRFVDVHAKGHARDCFIGSGNLISNPQEFCEVITDWFAWSRAQVGKSLVESLSASGRCSSIQAFTENMPHVGGVIEMIDKGTDIAGARIVDGGGSAFRPLAVVLLFGLVLAACCTIGIWRSIGRHFFVSIDDGLGHRD